MITDFQTTKVYFSSWLSKTCPKLWDALHSILVSMDVSFAFIENTADIWCRDYMPIQISRNEMVSYKYLPDYLVNDGLQSYITDTRLMVQNIQKEFPYITIKSIDLIIDGGNIVKCNDTIIMTEKVFEENRDKSKSAVINLLEKAFGCEVLFLPWDRAERFGHSDGIVHYIGGNRVLLTNYNDFSPSYFQSFMTRLEKKFEVIPLAYPIEKKSKNNWAYINYLQVGTLVLIPQLGIPEDQLAIEQISKVVPNTCHVIGVPAIEAVKMGGALNCISWNII